ncbi:MAG: ATP-binding protein, partial [Tannerella sp.]|nr:ATP-binding protein [Tannerella sp.]
MDKEVIKRIINEKRNEIIGLDLVRRPINLEPSANYVFVGLRRAGKSYTMYQIVKGLLKNDKTKKRNI